MRVDVNKARRNGKADDVNDLSGRLLGQIANSCYGIAGDPDIRAYAGTAEAVINHAAAQNQVSHGQIVAS